MRPLLQAAETLMLGPRFGHHQRRQTLITSSELAPCLLRRVPTNHHDAWLTMIDETAGHQGPDENLQSRIESDSAKITQIYEGAKHPILVCVVLSGELWLRR
jgi:hypothetical protein